MSNSLLKTNTDLAFKLADDADAASGTASQAMAWVLRSLHSDYITQGGMRIPGKNGEASQIMPVPSWDALHKGGEARNLFVSAVKHSLGVVFAGATKDETFKQRAARNTNNGDERRHANLIGRSIDFAAALERRAVPMDNYGKARIRGKEYPVWRVPARMLAMPEWVLRGEEADRPDMLRALDGRSIIADMRGKDGGYKPVQNAVASVDQFKRATFGAKPAKAKGADEVKAPAPIKLDNGKEVPFDFNRLVRAAGSLIAEITDNGSATVKLSDFDDETRKALDALYLFYQEAQQAAAGLTDAS